VSARILLIEDNPANLELMSYLLRAFGYAPRTFGDGVEGVSAAQRDPPDLIICDVQLPTMDGYEVARLLKSDPVLRAIPLVAVTALAMVGDRERTLAAGFDRYISKPINPETFVQQIEDVLKHQPRPFVLTPHSDSPPPSRPPQANHTVLVVDNLVINIELARSILEPHGYRVIAATGVHEGLRAARQNHFDLILSDVCMSGESGYDFIQAVKADNQLAAIPFVFLTSTMVDERDRAHGLALGATRFLFRPIEPDVLLAEIKACLQEGKSANHGDHPDSR
jgi:two-component system cell cycle response regulator